jgi:hypothetical protein
MAAAVTAIVGEARNTNRRKVTLSFQGLEISAVCRVSVRVAGAIPIPHGCEGSGPRTLRPPHDLDSLRVADDLAEYGLLGGVKRFPSK